MKNIKIINNDMFITAGPHNISRGKNKKTN